MGVEIVKAAMVYGKSLSGNGYKVLIQMAMSALDKPKEGRPASLYFAGWDALAIALGYENADRGTAGHNAVARATRELRKSRHITPLNDARTGVRQSYMVHPGGLPTGTEGEQNAHAQGEQNAHTLREQNAHVSVSKMLTPRKDQGSSQGLTQDRTPHEAASTTGSAGASKDAAESESAKIIQDHPHIGGPDDDCETCGCSRLNRIHAGHRPRLRAV